MPNTIIKYTSRTYESILTDINNVSEMTDKPSWFKKLISGVGDQASMQINATANNTLLPTAYTRRNVQALLKLIDYEMSEKQTSTGTVLFYVNGSASFPVSLSIAEQVANTAGGLVISSKRFEGRTSVSITAVSETFTANAGNDLLTVARVYTTGEKVRFTTTNTLPDPLAIDTDYYVIYASDTTIYISESLADAYAGTYIDLTDTGTGTHTMHLYSKQVTMYQQTSKDEYTVGDSDGTTEWQEFDLADIDILSDTISVSVNSLSYTLVTEWIDSTATDRHFRILYNTDNSAKLQFGNGTYGIIPPAFPIYVSYAVGGGVDSNVIVTNSINIYAGSNTDIEGVSNPSSLTGGANEEGIETAKVLAPVLLKTRDRFVTDEDGEALSENYTGIAHARVLGNYYGVLSAKVICIANGGGNPTSTIQTALQNYLIARSIMETIDIRVVDTTITPVNITCDFKLFSGYTWTGSVENYATLAWKLFLSECGKQIYDLYLSSGINDTITLINTIFSTSFLSTDSATVLQIDQLVKNLEYYYRTIGEDGDLVIQESDVFAYIQNNVFGVNYMTLTGSPFPLTVATDEITTPGSLTLGEL